MKNDAVPEPPHVPVLVGEEAVGVVAAVLDVVEAAAVGGRGRVPRSGAGEAVHGRAVRAAVGAAFAHAEAKRRESVGR